MPEPDLTLAPPPDNHRLIPMLVIAGIVMTAVGVAVYMLNPRKTAEITVQKTEVFAPHTEFKQTPSSSQIVGAAAASEDDVYVVATLRIQDKLRLPIFLTNTSSTMTNEDGSTLEATVVPPLDLPRLEQTFPQIVPLVSAPAPPPLEFEDAIAAGTTRAGTVVLLFPQTTEKQWRAKKSATLTVHLAHDAAPINVPLP
ncbi:hypothetical protein [Granulicella sp. L46]|uniref:hypothetical protein n=1 Tax=Granulicella sp. L46 TaxID=1641865 RepID=UPI00131C7735|nr:hypothetical protein [Granulicella sp. L46]